MGPFAQGRPGQEEGRRGPGRRPRPLPRPKSAQLAGRRAADHARASQVLRDQDPPRADDEVRQVPREHGREDQRGLARRQPRGPAQRGRHRPGGRARQPRREPADHGDPLQGRLAPDAPQDQAARRGRRRLRGRGSRWVRPTLAAVPSPAGAGAIAASTSKRAGSSGRSSRLMPSARPRSRTRPGRRPTSTASCSRPSRPRGSSPWPTPTGTP